MSNSKEEWKIQGSRVFGFGCSYNCTNKITAEQLHNTLNTYEQNLQLEKNITEQYDKLNKQIIALQMDLSNIQDTVNQLKETIQCMSK